MGKLLLIKSKNKVTHGNKNPALGKLSVLRQTIVGEVLIFVCSTTKKAEFAKLNTEFTAVDQYKNLTFTRFS